MKNIFDIILTNLKGSERQKKAALHFKKTFDAFNEQHEKDFISASERVRKGINQGMRRTNDNSL